MTPSEATRLAGMLKAAHPRQDIDEATLAIYAAFLADLDRDAGERAVREAIATIKFFPSIAEIRDLAMRGAIDAPPEHAAWNEVMRAVRLDGRYRTPKWSHRAIAAAINAIGWVSLCDSENLEADRAHFLRLYRDATESAVREANVRPMLAAAAERTQLARAGGVIPMADALKRLKGGKGDGDS